MHSKDDHIEVRRDNHIEAQGRCNGNYIELLATIYGYGADIVVRQEFMSASDRTEDEFTFELTAPDVTSFEHCSWLKDRQAMENATHISKTPDLDLKAEKDRL